MFVVNERNVEAHQLAGRSSKLLISAANGSEMITHNAALFPRGHAPGHVHRVEDEVFFVDSGEGEVWIEGVPYRLRPGTAVHTPSNVIHNVHGTSIVPLHLLGFMSPHTVPGSYPDLPPLSRDLEERPENRAPFVSYEDELAVHGDSRTELMQTERVMLAIMSMIKGMQHKYAADGRDLIVHVLEGAGDLTLLATIAGDTRAGEPSALEPGYAILLTGDEIAVVSARSDMRLLEARATRWTDTEAHS